MNILKLLEDRVIKALNAAGAPEDTPAMVRQSARANFGDYQCNAVMAAAKKMGQKPRDLAQTVVDHLDLDGIADKTEIAGPGFINIYLAPEFLAKGLHSAVSDERIGVEAVAKPQTVIVDYSAPNVAKEMHVGHLRSTIIGDSTARTLEFLGHKVIRQNHLGDWGTQFGMLIAHLEELEQSNQEEAMDMELSDLETFYKAAKKHFDDDEIFAAKARDYVVRLQAGEPHFKKLWKRLVDVTLSHNQEVYERLNVSLTPGDVMGESAYNDSLPVIIKELDSKGLLSEDQGAKVVFLDEFKNKDGDPMGVIVEKSGGGFLYSTTDLAAIRHRVHTLNANRVLYYVDARQGQHFEQVYTIARKAGFATDDVQLEHHAFGMMLGKDGKPFKTRAGTTIKLVDLLNEAEERAARLLASKDSDLSEEQKVNVIKAVAMGSVKYADLSKNRTSDYVFDWDNMLAFEGNTAPYMLYAYTRVQSIFRKAGVSEAGLKGDIAISEPTERELALKLARFSETVEQAAREGMPHIVCGYLYELSGAFMSFYECCPVNKEGVSEALKNSRLQLCSLTARTIKQGLDLLGIETVEQM
ncbi:arginyl-tRNA synthetase [Endozoicomonas montiporae]|uniref:Arginine--tRNA ligase n=2 Tax=Endozoicomonas montiporae TaxID=1027273 RepID=A0A081N485_9GAMM|nr:arginine--tRNA ligase [Endozoicomonas montiporae]AMO57900.1 arginyl-tRNA synthetase [Endozoicomonas montiporae CL-33]KEQ13258.1 arginyl-tRNA synthetase [Endozoicomonas montiporae]